MALSDLVARAVAFLRAGYPQGVRATDYVPLITLLRRRLSDDEVVAVASELAARGVLPNDATDIRVAITKITDEMPSPDEVERVKQRLRSGGWPIGDRPGGPGGWRSSPSHGEVLSASGRRRRLLCRAFRILVASSRSARSRRRRSGGSRSPLRLPRCRSHRWASSFRTCNSATSACRAAANTCACATSASRGGSRPSSASSANTTASIVTHALLLRFRLGDDCTAVTAFGDPGQPRCILVPRSSPL